MIPRILTKEATQMMEWFPIISITGPRQSGKSTLIRHTFPEFKYLNLELPHLREEATNDPEGFIMHRGDHLIIDEAQVAPDIFTTIQAVSDEHHTMGQYILSGSQNFLMHKKITESLAGRVGIMRLLPLSYQELANAW